jgi:hypothetical protein
MIDKHYTTLCQLFNGDIQLDFSSVLQGKMIYLSA